MNNIDVMFLKNVKLFYIYSIKRFILSFKEYNNCC